MINGFGLGLGLDLFRIVDNKISTMQPIECIFSKRPTKGHPN